MLTCILIVIRFLPVFIVQEYGFYTFIAMGFTALFNFWGKQFIVWIWGIVTSEFCSAGGNISALRYCNVIHVKNMQLSIS
jgi:hypothetical protein